MGICGHWRLYAVINNECKDDLFIQIHIKPAKLTIQMFLEPHPQEVVGQMPHPSPG